MCHLNGFQCLRNRTNLVQLDQNRISCSKLNTFGKSFRICYEQVVANKLYFISQSCSKFLPSFPVFFVQTVLDGNNRIFLAEFSPVFNKFFCCIFCTCFWQFIISFSLFTLPFRRSCIHCDLKIFSWFISSFLHGFQNCLNCLFI